ncbi:MAG: hypothetical protein ACP5M0_05725 [Desulfomonilaceae bacterium]
MCDPRGAPAAASRDIRRSPSWASPKDFSLVRRPRGRQIHAITKRIQPFSKIVANCDEDVWGVIPTNGVIYGQVPGFRIESGMTYQAS